MKKVNTTVYHPQTDGCVKNFNKTLLSMIPILRSLDIASCDKYIQHLYCLPIVLHDMILLMNYHLILYMDMMEESLQKMLCQPYKLIIKFILMIINRTLLLVEYWTIAHCKNKIVKITNLLVSTFKRDSGNCNLMVM